MHVAYLTEIVEQKCGGYVLYYAMYYTMLCIILGLHSLTIAVFG
jgi:hypothetical protein